MNETIVPFSSSSDDVLEKLFSQLPALSPELQKAATYILENPYNVGICTIREIANAASVSPNSFVRLAQYLGYPRYKAFRAPFREQFRNEASEFPDRARRLQSASKGGKLASLYSEMAGSAIRNIEHSFADSGSDKLKTAADSISSARHTFALGIGANHSLVQNFAYLSEMAVEGTSAIPKPGSTAVDDLAHAGKQDVLIAITFKPYRTEVVEAVNIALDQGVKIIAISDSLASPIVTISNIFFIVKSETPQFFPSTVATLALLETLVAFIIANSGEEVVTSIERFHERRHLLGTYYEKSRMKN